VTPAVFHSAGVLSPSAEEHGALHRDDRDTPTGKYLTSAAGDGTVNYNYDPLDRLITKATPEGTLSYTYYANGNVETIASSNPNGVSVTLTWDALNRLSSVIDNRLSSGANTAVYTYDPAGNVATATYPNCFQMTFTYDQLSRMKAVSTPVSSYTYQLGPTGIRTGATEGNGRTLTWNYDGIYRLTSEAVGNDQSGGNGEADYTLDPVGNRTSANSSLPGVQSVTLASFNLDDWLSPETYDANGNVLTAGGISYTYDSENHMISATGNGKVVTMVYDAFGNRVAKTVNDVTTKYLVEDDVNPTGLPQVLEETINSVVQRTYTYGLQRISESLMVNGAWTTSFYGYDGSGSVRQLTNSTGIVTDEYEYDAFGNSFTKSGTTPNNYLYRGEQYDPDLGLYYLRARYYNPATGRFFGRDPAGGRKAYPATLHRYLYANGDPINGMDPSGREDIITYADIDAHAALTAKRVADTFGCVSSILFTSASVLLAQNLNGWFAAGVGTTYYGCASIVIPTAVTPAGIFFQGTLDYGTCALALAQLTSDLSKSDTSSATINLDGFSAIVGCVTTQLTKMFEEEALE
jgi:RHS repeat-associated protein